MSSYLALALVAGFGGIERKGALQAMLSRPIAIATIAGLAMGDAAGGLLVAIPLELLWLGAVNLGAALPVHEALGAAAVAGGAVMAGRALGTGVTWPVAALAFLVCAPMAIAGRTLDRVIERANERLVDRAETLVARNPDAAARTNLWGLALPFVAPATLAPLGAAAAAAVVPALLRAAPALEAPLSTAWVAFGAMAACAAAVSLRGPRTPQVFLAAASVAAAAGAVVVAAGGVR